MLLDVTPSQEMVDEGVAREIINKIQKLRKKVSKRGNFVLTIQKSWDGCVSDAIGWTSAVRPGRCSL